MLRIAASNSTAVLSFTGRCIVQSHSTVLYYISVLSRPTDLTLGVPAPVLITRCLHDAGNIQSVLSPVLFYESHMALLIHYQVTRDGRNPRILARRQRAQEEAPEPESCTTAPPMLGLDGRRGRLPLRKEPVRVQDIPSGPRRRRHSVRQRAEVPRHRHRHRRAGGEAQPDGPEHECAGPGERAPHTRCDMQWLLRHAQRWL